MSEPRTFWIWLLKDVALVLAGALVISGVAITGVTILKLYSGTYWASGTFELEDGTKLEASTPLETRKILKDPSLRFSKLAVRPASHWGSFLMLSLFATMGWIAVYVLVRDRRRLGGWFKPSLRAASAGVLAAGVMLVLAFGYDKILALLGIEQRNLARLAFDQLSFATLLVLGALFAPIAEELYFRGRLHDLVFERMGGAWAAGLTTGIFAIAHFDLVNLPIYTLAGLVLLWLRRWTGGLVAPIITHSVHNLVAILMMKADAGS